MTYQQGPGDVPRFFHLHMVSDASGETLAAIAKAAAVQYSGIRAVKHSHPFVRHRRQIDRIVQQIEATPGVVFYTIVDRELGLYFEKRCEELKVPCIGVLEPLLKVFESYLGMPSTPVVGGQHVLNTDYFARIEAVNYTLNHDDGNRTDELEHADVVIIGASRTSKTPTSLYLANRGIKTANVSLVPEIAPPESLKTLTNPLVVGLVASPQRIAEIRRHRLLGIKDTANQDYTDTEKISGEMKFTRQLCARYGWVTIDITRRSIEETAAAIIKLREERVVDV